MIEEVDNEAFDMRTIVILHALSQKIRSNKRTNIPDPP